MDVEIRAARRSDIPGVLAVWAVARSPAATTPDDEAVVGALLDHDPEALLVAVAGERVVGALVAGFDGWRGSMYRLGVMPELRRRGVGRALVDAGHGRLRAAGCRRVGALVAPGEEDAVALWEAAGYRFDSGVARFVRHL